ncbi:23S rRNA (pseudouridine(1915)-N(3))-methyltransferase RlmH [Lamprobacter modestohalophilus]|uniref:Ribosomal RNA large subunit methyltransferase H n=1 Tax=Lamprobacter modestohalophilus TaxID=1064514 RepID=A0A9X0WAL5_9GAMM|nr:23S rRNA (pseudouridine(1915)-N(3))-methyltransferase RlmH [Lamprobacter modestohalophilus]MBK1619894.1 23S rRNA (pseudouridine(1915)-N(3))-methyltransferase RlmH [Lamprobacter modestohalophilus]
MRIQLLCVGRRMPTWVNEGFAEYAKRLPPSCALSLVEIEPAARGKGLGRGRTKTGQRAQLSPAERDRLLTEEGERLLKATPNTALAVALDVRGRAWSTEALARELEAWMAGGRDLAFLVGGPDGLSHDCLARAEQRWSLSPLTFPHPLVRVILAEQLYRAWTLTQGHPYHRGSA